MESYSSKPLVEPLDTENYPVWSIRMRAALQGLGLWKYVSKGLPEAPVTRSSDRETEGAAEEKAFSHIILSVLP